MKHEQHIVIRYGDGLQIDGTQCTYGGVMFIDKITRPDKEYPLCIHLNGTQYVDGQERTGFLMSLLFDTGCDN